MIQGCLSNVKCDVSERISNMVGYGDSVRHSILVYLHCKLWYGWPYGKGTYPYPISLELSQACHNANIEVAFGWNLGASLYSKYCMNIPSCSVKIRNSLSPHDSNFEGALCLQNNSVCGATLNTYFSWNSCPPLLWNNFIDEGHSSDLGPETYWLKTGINCPLPLYSRKTVTVQPPKPDISGVSSLHALPCKGQGQQRWWL